MVQAFDSFYTSQEISYSIPDSSRAISMKVSMIYKESAV